MSAIRQICTAMFAMVLVMGMVLAQEETKPESAQPTKPTRAELREKQLDVSLETRDIEGVVRWDGGEPAGWIQVDLVDKEFDEVVDRMASRPDGTFRMFGLEGRDYRLKLQSMPASGFSSVQAEVDLNREVRAPLQLVLEPGN